VDAIDAAGSLDFATIVEAAGNTPKGALASWSRMSAVLSSMTPLSMTTGHETHALFYDAARWLCTYTSHGAFDPGRPWLLASFERHGRNESHVAPLWIVAVHLPHFLDTQTVPGSVLAAALANASSASGQPKPSKLIIAGDFNEFEWEDNPCLKPYYPDDCREQARAKMAPLWDDYLGGSARDIAPDHTITCCTKWSVADRFSTNYTEWRFEYDHVFVAGDGGLSEAAQLLSYTYPGTAEPCADPVCTGEDPPANATATHQGSWHRGWTAELDF